MIITTQHLFYYCIYLKILSGLDGTRTRDPLRDRTLHLHFTSFNILYDRELNIINYLIYLKSQQYGFHQDFTLQTQNTFKW